MATRKFVIVPVGSGYPFFHGIDLSDFNGIRSKYHRKINLASRGSMTSDIRIDFTQQIIDKLGGLPRCTRFATRTVPYGRDFEAEFTQTSVAVVHGGSQQIGQRFAVSIAGEDGGIHIQFVDNAMHIRQCEKNVFVDLTLVFGVGCIGCADRASGSDTRAA